MAELIDSDLTAVLRDEVLFTHQGDCEFCFHADTYLTPVGGYLVCISCRNTIAARLKDVPEVTSVYGKTIAKIEYAKGRPVGCRYTAPVKLPSGAVPLSEVRRVWGEENTTLASVMQRIQGGRAFAKGPVMEWREPRK